MADVTIRPAWMNIPFHALFTRPGIEVDGRGQQLRWGTNEVDVPDGARIGVYFHYRGRPNQRLALTEATFGGTRLRAVLGIRNSAKFTLTAPSTPAAHPR